VQDGHASGSEAGMPSLRKLLLIFLQHPMNFMRLTDFRKESSTCHATSFTLRRIPAARYTASGTGQSNPDMMFNCGAHTWV